MPGDVKLIVCAATNTVNERDTELAAAKEALPGWLAVMEHVPALNKLNAVPLTLQTVGVVEANATLKPDDALAVSATAAAPKLVLAGCAKVMVCAVAATLNEFETLAAAE